MNLLDLWGRNGLNIGAYRVGHGLKLKTYNCIWVKNWTPDPLEVVTEQPL